MRKEYKVSVIWGVLWVCVRVPERYSLEGKVETLGDAPRLVCKPVSAGQEKREIFSGKLPWDLCCQ